MPKICELKGVRGGEEDWPVELWRDRTGRLVIVGYNEGGCNSVDIDLLDLVEWLRNGDGSGLQDIGVHGIRIGPDPE